MDDVMDIWVNMTSSCRYLADGSFTILRDVSSCLAGHPPPELEGRGGEFLMTNIHAILLLIRVIQTATTQALAGDG